MTRFDDPENLYLKAKRKYHIEFTSAKAEEIFKDAFYFGLMAFDDYMGDISVLSPEDALKELDQTNKEISDYIEEVVKKNS